MTELSNATPAVHSPGLFCVCTNWCRAEVNLRALTNHHPNCEHYNDSLIDVWRVSLGGSHYFCDFEPNPEDCDSGETITKEQMHREVYEQLPEFGGF